MHGSKLDFHICIEPSEELLVVHRIYILIRPVIELYDAHLHRVIPLKVALVTVIADVDPSRESPQPTCSGIFPTPE